MRGIKKIIVLTLLLDSIFLAVFNAVFFILGGIEQETTIWISYGSIHLAYIICVVTPFFGGKMKKTPLLGVTIESISFVYFMVVFLVNVLLIVWHPIFYAGTLLIQIVLTGIYMVLFLATLIANERTADYVKQKERDLQYVNSSTARLKEIMDSITDRRLRKQVERCYDLIQSSPISSNNFAREYEVMVMELIDGLERKIQQNNSSEAEIIIGRIIKAARERNWRLMV